MKLKISPDIIRHKQLYDVGRSTDRYDLILSCDIAVDDMFRAPTITVFPESGHDRVVQDDFHYKSQDEIKEEAMWYIQKFIDEHANIKYNRVIDILEEYRKEIYKDTSAAYDEIHALHSFSRYLTEKYNEGECLISEDTSRCLRAYCNREPVYKSLPAFISDMEMLHHIFHDEMPKFFTKLHVVHDDSNVVRMRPPKGDLEINSWEISIDPSIESYYTVAVKERGLLLGDIKVPVKYVRGDQERLNVYIEALRGMLE